MASSAFPTIVIALHAGAAAKLSLDDPLDLHPRAALAGVPWTLIARHAAQILGQPVSDVGRLAATLRQRAWSVSRDHEIRAGASGAGTSISSSSSGRDQLGGKDSEMPSEKKIIKRTTTVTTEELEPEQPEEKGLDDLDDQDEPDDDEEEGRGKPRGKRPSRAA